MEVYGVKQVGVTAAAAKEKKEAFKVFLHRRDGFSKSRNVEARAAKLAEKVVRPGLEMSSANDSNLISALNVKVSEDGGEG